MLQELLLSLVGFTGDLILDESERRAALGLPPLDNKSAPTFRLAPDISFIDESQRSAIERLIPLGFYYKELQHFISMSRSLTSIKSRKNSLPHHPSEVLKEKPRAISVYRRAIANGIVEILSVYSSAVLQVEQNLLSEPFPILATVTKSLNKFEVLLPPLYELIAEVERKDIKGGQLLNLLYKRCHCGIPELQACIQRLLWHGHQVMYNQLAAWMIYGMLQDQHREFFIRRQDAKDFEIESSHSNVVDKQSSEDAPLTDWHSGFHIHLDMLPEYIDMRIAESILFAGKAVRVLRNPNPTFRMQESVIYQPILRGSHRFKDLLGSIMSQKERLKGDYLLEEELVPQRDADNIESMLQKLKEYPEFNKRLFESAINSIKTIAANHLWQLVVVRADLNGHLKALKDYFLLAKGDFFQCFLEESRQLMRLPPRQSTAVADLMVPFQLAALKTIGEEDKYFSRLSLRFSVPSSQVGMSQSKVNTDGLHAMHLSSTELPLDDWDGISLDYSVGGPLQLVFTPEVLHMYCTVFQYLIRLKRTQMELEKSWASGMHQDHTDFANRHKDRKNRSTSQHRLQRYRPMWPVREHMIFLIRNLQFYIQVDVIESQWNALQARLLNSHDFTELVGFHQEYLSALISQSFLDIGSVSRILDSIMKLCLRFCWNIERHESNPDLHELERITEEFNKKSNSLYTILRSSRLAGSQRAPFLRQFLMRLNFNSFFETTARGVLNVVRSRPALPVPQQ